MEPSNYPGKVTELRVTSSLIVDVVSQQFLFMFWGERGGKKQGWKREGAEKRSPPDLFFLIKQRLSI